LGHGSVLGIDEKNREEVKVHVFAMYLTRTMKIWWRNRVEDLVFRRIIENIENWTDMKATLKPHFSLGNQAWLARK